MNQLDTDLHDAYRRCHERLCNPDPYANRLGISVDDVLRAHFLLCDFFLKEGEDIALAGPRSDDLLMSALGRPHTAYGGQVKWKTEFERVATLFYGLIKNHAFHDGNKRTALLVALLYLSRLKRVPDVKQRDLETLAVRAAAGQLAEYKARREYTPDSDGDIYFLADHLRRKTRQIDRTLYSTTFRELNSVLGQFGYSMANPTGNSIDIMKIEVRRPLRRGFRKETIERRVLHIGFPGWSREVAKGDIRRIREATGLTAENGYDSQVFFNGADPLASLISRYEGPLRRLRDR